MKSRAIGKRPSNPTCDSSNGEIIQARPPWRAMSNAGWASTDQEFGLFHADGGGLISRDEHRAGTRFNAPQNTRLRANPVSRRPTAPAAFSLVSACIPRPHPGPEQRGGPIRSGVARPHARPPGPESRGLSALRRQLQPGRSRNGRQSHPERGKDYNHSTFCDLVITGLVGLRPRPDDIIEVNPLVPEGTWDYFCLDGVRYHGRTLTILYDRTGTRYRRGAGLQVLVDGQRVARSDSLQRLTAPAAHAESPKPAASD